MKVNEPQCRLQSLWGLIDRQHNQQIARMLQDSSHVLDVGCGYGALVDYLSQGGHQVRGIDLHEESVAIAHAIFPQAQVSVDAAESLTKDFAGHFDAIILKDVLHHIVGEGDPISSFKAFRQLLRDEGRLVILDPNPMLILRLARTLVRHQDPEANPQLAQKVLTENGFVVQQMTYYEIIGLPLSGGYVGYRLVPNWKPLNQVVAGTNHVLSRALVALGLGRYLCWRYIICAQKTTHDAGS
jgi:SAM-dependent methyltransferase